MKGEETIRIENLSTGYSLSKGEKVITQNLTAALRRGELTCLLGRNGAGKSTLLRTLAGFQKPLSGDLQIEGKSISEYSDIELAKKIGVVLTERPMPADMDVETLVGLGRSPYTDFWGRLRDADKRLVDDAIAMTGIESLRHRDVQSLSDGERQKAMIAKALAQDTPVVFLDEPTAFLDYPSKVEILLLLRRLAHDMGKTVFMSTHDLELAVRMADRLWLINREYGVKSGTPQELTAKGDIEKFLKIDKDLWDLWKGRD